MGYPIGWTDIQSDCIDREFIQNWDINWESDTSRLTERKQNRKDRLRCLGNSIVPQIALVLFDRLKEIIEISQTKKLA